VRTKLAMGAPVRAALLLCLCLTACVREDPDARLDADPGFDPKARAALLKLDCTRLGEEAQAARDERQSKSDRISNYQLAVKSFSASAERLETAFNKEPDLLYASEGEVLRERLQRCQAQARTFTDELRRYELVAQLGSAAPERIVERPMPVVKKAKRGKTMVARGNKKRSGHHAILADAR
jgi:hypothetical protein